MNITVVSDTHGDFETLYQIVQQNPDSDLFIHLGDGEHEYYDVQSAFYDKPFITMTGETTRRILSQNSGGRSSTYATVTDLNARI